ncbi:gamma-tubulin complex component 2 isoform X2 [Dermacentor silvarum]|uniref:gamma-tubulin complex component 2 isoform X2 n=1 Tax=Dermacentor silvarum TaxID=543639 RepID=UPI001897DB23|nr:gamma-tubulin complex component 2 isoform X2 [Dermacentor silvarum]
MSQPVESANRNGTSHRRSAPTDGKQHRSDMAQQARVRQRKEPPGLKNAAAPVFAEPKLPNFAGVTIRSKRQFPEKLDELKHELFCDGSKGDRQKKVTPSPASRPASMSSLTSFAPSMGMNHQVKSVALEPVTFGLFVDDSKVSWDFVPYPRSSRDPKTEPIGALPLSTQEYKLLEDLIYVMLGVDAIYIRSQPLQSPHAERTFTIDESADPSLKEMVKKILPLCSHYSTVVRFIEEKQDHGQGMVNQALAAAMRDLLDDYLVLVTQLEHKLVNQGALTLPKAWFYVQPSLAYMNVLATCAQAVWAGQCYGGKTLGMLHKQATSLTGDTKARDICLFLAKAASVPYFNMLESWVYRGCINDPFKEFLVGDKSLVKKEDMFIDNTDNYWNSRYALRSEMIPGFLRTLKDRILNTGKYQNVILQCGQRPASCSGDDRLCYSLDEREYIEKIDIVYHKASRMLLNLLMDKVDLMGRLRSVKHFFLMDQGDFVVQFMDMAEEELGQNIDDIVPTRLELLLQLAVSTSSVGNDRYKDCVKHQILESNLASQMEKLMGDEPDKKTETCMVVGHEAFTLNYDVEWPLNLVITTTSLGCYQMVFRYLFYLTHVERMLSKVWVRDKAAKQRSAAYPVVAFGLRQRMMHFVKNLQYFVTVEVIEPCWHVFQDRMQKVQTIDEVLELHTDLTASFVDLCMLTNNDVFQLIHDTLQQCLQFSSFMLGDTKGENFEERVNHFQHVFHNQLSSLRKKLLEGGAASHSTHEINLAEMLHRIDFNRFYSSTPE